MTHHVSISWNIYIMYYLVTATHTADNWQYKVGNHQMSYFENTQYRNYSIQVLVAIWPTKSSFWVANLCALYNDFIISVMASQITGVSIVCSIVGSGADQRKHQSSASLALVREFTGDRWILCTKAQYSGKCLQLMTSSWFPCAICALCYKNVIMICFWSPAFHFKKLYYHKYILCML